VVRRVALVAVLIWSASVFGDAATRGPLVGIVGARQRVQSCQLFRDGFVYLQWSGPEATPVGVPPGEVGPYARVTARYGGDVRTDLFIPDGYTGSATFPAAHHVGWPERLICADNSGADLPAIVPCANPKKSFVDGGPDINFDGLSVDGSSLTATWDAFINNFFPTGRATFQHDSYYFQIDGSKPRIVRVTGGTSRVLEQRFTGLEHGVHELVYGTGELSEKILWNVCVKT